MASSFTVPRTTRRAVAVAALAEREWVDDGLGI